MKARAAAILVIFCLGIFTVHMVKGSVGSQSMRKYSCVSLSTQQLNIQNLISYERQQAPVNAIMFLAIAHRKIYVRTDLQWVQGAMEIPDGRQIKFPMDTVPIYP
ncbi:lymphotactin-like [Limosa lapponica baueri]|uniref:Lymphotactin-like n=1 Tax=Limosa lapponica baueri TaxID=1758121 RepID=A0A2I0TWA9_LIMLA|nr:lymphotactin-like [Limosa lapponica baueri]